LDPEENANTMNNLACLRLDNGGAPSEEQTFEEHGLRRSAKNPNFADTRHAQKERWKQCSAMFGGLVQRYLDNPVFRYHYRLFLFQAGQPSRAKSELGLPCAIPPTLCVAAFKAALLPSSNGGSCESRGVNGVLR
jgi:hypothetical protein